MSNYWDVITNAEQDKWACQRDDQNDGHETTGWMQSEDAAIEYCATLNAEVDDEPDPAAEYSDALMRGNKS